MKIKLFLILLLVCQSMTMSLFANEPMLITLEQILAEYQAKFQLNAVILITRQNQRIFEKHVGYANIAQKSSFTPTTVFPIASISKQFTAVAILLLEEEGKIKLHQPIVDYLPKHHPVWQGHMPAWANQVTVHHMLTHSSGLVNYTDKTFLQNITHKENMAHLFASITRTALKFEPGTKFEYSNTGFLLLGVIIETISKQTLSEFFKKRLFDVAQMDNTFLPTVVEEGQLIQQGRISDLIYYCAKLSDKTAPLTVVTHPFEVVLQGGASIFSTQQDLLKWTKALYQHKILLPKTLALMLKPHIAVHDPWFGRSQYGYGIFIDKHHDQLLYHHGGWIEGVRTMLSYCPKNQTTVMLLSNLSPDETQPESEQISQGLAFNQLAIRMHHLLND
ncbi:MAG: beta-lactamase family protein [Proteobacteria bacterium]|nr:beta-lactamase family protein [Pseudomonadota bacterium]